MKQEPLIKAIDTEYNGMLFRSRLEARWAVFFDAAGIKYEYEPEGFEHDGVRYLPDFYLPEFDMYAEVKPDRSGIDEDINKCWRMIYWGGPIKRLLFLGNIPGPCNGGSWNFPVIYYSASDTEGDCVKSGWWTFMNVIEMDDDMKMHSTPETTGTIVNYGVYHCPFLNYHGDIIGMYNKETMNHECVSLHPQSDYALEEKHTCSKEKLDRISKDENKYLFDAFKKARCARFEFKRE